MTDKDQSPTTLAEEDVERVAQAIYHAEYAQEYTMQEGEGRFYRDAARAAISAMPRSPDPTAAYPRGREDMRREALEILADEDQSIAYSGQHGNWIERQGALKEAHAVILALLQAKTPGREPDRTWRCFHCDDIFTTVETARKHFGADEIAKTGCQIDVAEYRRLEQQQAQCRAECCEEAKRYGAAEDDRRRALVREEQKGYDKGLRDARTERVPSVIAEAVRAEREACARVVEGQSAIVMARPHSSIDSALQGAARAVRDRCNADLAMTVEKEKEK